MRSLYTLTTYSEISNLSDYIQQNIHAVKSIVAFDTESTGRNAITDKVIGYSISLYEDEGFYIPFYTFTDDKGLCTEITEAIPKEGQNTERRLYETISPASKELALKILESLKAYKLLMHNAPYDVIICRRNFNVDLCDALHCDTIMLKHTVDCEKPHGLKECGIKYFGEDAADEQTELGGSVIRNGGKWNKQNHEVWYGDLYYVGKYAAQDTCLTLRIYNRLSKDLTKMGLDDLFYNLEVMPLMKTCTINMKDIGFKVNLDHFIKAKLDIQAEIDELDRQIYEEISDVVEDLERNILNDKYPPRPDKTFAEYLILEVGLPLPLSPKTGDFSLAKGVKTEWLERHKLKGTAEQLKVLWYIEGTADKIGDELISKVQRKMWEDKVGGHIVNVNSNVQFADIVGRKWDIRSPVTTKTGEQSFTADIIERITIARMMENEDIGEVEALEKFEEYMECDKLPVEADWFIKYLRKKKLEKIVSTYIDAVLELNVNGVIHSDFQQFGTTSGRYSMKDPNLQNLPSHSALGKVIKQGFTA